MSKTSLIFFVLFAFIQTVSANEPAHFHFAEEPTIRIGLATNVGAVSITTGDAQLTAQSANEPSRFLATNRVSVQARAYRPPEIEVYKLEISGIPTLAEAETTAKDVREATGETAVVSQGFSDNTFRVVIGAEKPTLEEIAAFKDTIGDKGFGQTTIASQRKKQPSTDALQLSANKSLIKSTVSTVLPDVVQPTLDPNLREVIVSGATPAAKYASLKPVSFGSTSDRSVPVRVNGKAYRGRIEVFVNERGSLTVVNTVKIEDYLMGVVPNELGFPAIEAQKAQAIAARTYAIKNIGQFGKQGFDLLPTIRSQVYEGFSSENAMASRAVMETRGIVAMHNGKPIMAYYTSTCGGRTENVENIFDSNEPYLRGVECSLEGKSHFEPSLVKSSRELPKIEREGNAELARQVAFLAVNNFLISTNKLSDDYFADAPNEAELRNWFGIIAARSATGIPAVINQETAKPANFAGALAAMLYQADYADTLLSASDVNYNLGFADADKIPQNQRANVAILLRDGWLSLYPDSTLKPEKSLSRARVLNTVLRLADRKKWLAAAQTGTARTSENGKLIVQSGKTSRTLNVRPDVFLFRQFGDQSFQVKEAALIGGEPVSFHTDAAGNVDYLEIRPTLEVTTAERMSPLRFWNVSLSPGALQSRLSRYVRGIGTLYDLKIKQKGFSRRAVELEIVGSNGTKYLKGGKIRSALRFKEQLFVLNKRYGANGQVVGYNFTGRGWGHGVGMCQYGAFGLAKMGVKADKIIKHYYTGVDLTKAY